VNRNGRTKRNEVSTLNWQDLNYQIYEAAKKNLPKDLSPREYEEEVKRLAIKYNI